MSPFVKLDAFKASYQLGLDVVRSTEHWPKREMFGLSAQARRAATSVAINIAEGSMKRGIESFAGISTLHSGHSVSFK